MQGVGNVPVPADLEIEPMGRRGRSLQRLIDGVSEGDPTAIGVAIIVALVVGAILYFRFFRKRV